MIQITTQLIAVGDNKIVDPAAYVLTGFKELIAHADAPVSVGQYPYSLFKIQQRFWVPFDMPILECKSQELTQLAKRQGALKYINEAYTCFSSKRVDLRQIIG